MEAMLLNRNGLKSAREKDEQDEKQRNGPVDDTSLLTRRSTEEVASLVSLLKNLREGHPLAVRALDDWGRGSSMPGSAASHIRELRDSGSTSAFQHSERATHQRHDNIHSRSWARRRPSILQYEPCFAEHRECG